jgi:hypothetical protein
MKTKILVILFTVFALTGCKKKTLDFSSDTYFGIKDFLKSENANTKCGTTASCENKTVKLKGLLDEMNINEDIKQFWLIDEKNSKYTISVDVDSVISKDVFSKIKNKGGQLIKIEGIVNGFDKQTNTSCDRSFKITINDASKVIF